MRVTSGQRVFAGHRLTSDGIGDCNQGRPLRRSRACAADFLPAGRAQIGVRIVNCKSTLWIRMVGNVRDSAPGVGVERFLVIRHVLIEAKAPSPTLPSIISYVVSFRVELQFCTTNACDVRRSSRPAERSKSTTRGVTGVRSEERRVGKEWENSRR